MSVYLCAGKLLRYFLHSFWPDSYVQFRSSCCEVGEFLRLQRTFPINQTKAFQTFILYVSSAPGILPWPVTSLQETWRTQILLEHSSLTLGAKNCNQKWGPPALTALKPIKSQGWWKEKFAYFLRLSKEELEEISCSKASSPPPQSVGKSFFGRGRGWVHAERAQSALTVILK